MIKKEIVTKESEEITDIFCDICARSCKSSDYDMGYHGFEYMSLKANWGYGSNHDGEVWEAQVCERCVVEQLSLVVNFHRDGPAIYEYSEEEKQKLIAQQKLKYGFILEGMECVVDPSIVMPESFKEEEPTQALVDVFKWYNELKEADEQPARELPELVKLFKAKPSWE